MAGILANSASKTMEAGDTSADAVVSGFVTGERIVLGTNPTGESYSWGLSVPSASAAARSGLSSATDAAPTFTPDVAGTYVVTCTVDGTTTYVMRIAVVAVAVTVANQALRFSPVADAAVPAPAIGITLYYSSDHTALVVKDSENNVYPVDLGVPY